MEYNIKQYIIPISNDINQINQLINEFEEIKNKFNNNFQEFLNYQNSVFPIHNLASFSNHFYILSSDFNDLFEKLKKQQQQQQQTSIEISQKKQDNRNNDDEKEDTQEKPFVAFVFSGQGAQFNPLSFEVYNNEPVFKQSMDEIDKIMKEKYYGYSILEKMKNIKDEFDPAINNDQELTQTALLMVQVSLFKLYKYHYNLNPDIIVGHSFGEVVGSYASGMLPDLETLCYVVYNRGKLQQTTFGCGKTMMWIDRSDREFKEEFSNRYPTVEIACLLSPNNIVIGGETKEINEINEILKSKSIYTKVLSIPTAFHHSCQQVLKDDILKLQFNSNAPKIPHISTVYGKLFNSSFYFNQQYMFENLRDVARFAWGISGIYKHVEENDLGRNIVFLEIGPRASILNYVKKLIPIDKSNYFNSVSLLCSIQRDKGTQGIKEMLQHLKLKGYKNLKNC